MGTVTELNWCDYCQDAFPAGHHDEDGMYHKAGPEFGPAGLELWKVAEVRAYAEGPLKGTPHGDRILAILDARLPADEPDDGARGRRDPA